MEGQKWSISDVVRKTGIEPHVLRYWEKELCLNIPRNEFGYRYYMDKHVELFKQIHQMKDGGFQLKAIKTLISPEFLSQEENAKIQTIHTVYTAVGANVIAKEAPIPAAGTIGTLGSGSSASSIAASKQRINVDTKNTSNVIILNKVNDSVVEQEEDQASSDQKEEDELIRNLSRNYQKYIDADEIQTLKEVDDDQESQKTQTIEDEIEDIQEFKDKETEKKKEQQAIKEEPMEEDKVEIENDKINQFKEILSDVVLEALDKRDEKMGAEISDRIIKQMDYLMRLQDEFEEERFKRLDETIRLTQKQREAVGKQSFFHKLSKKKSRS